MAWKQTQVAAPVFNEIANLAGQATAAAGAITSAAAVGAAAIGKPKLERAEEFELDMCRNDVIRAKAALGED